MSIRPDLLQITPYNFTAKPHCVKLDQNESPYDLPQELKNQVAKLLIDTPFNRYPDMKAERLRTLLAEVLGWPAEGIAVGSGSNTLIRRLIEVCGLYQRVLTVQPTFSVYHLDAALLGVALTEVPLLDTFALPVDALAKEMQQGTGVLFIANPAAPTGNWHPKEELQELIRASKANDWTVVIDEAYYQFAPADHLELARANNNVVILRTFSKAFGLAGMRLGYALGSEHRMRYIREAITPFSVSLMQLLVAEAVAQYQGDFVAKYVREVKQEKQRLYDALAELQITYYPSETNFFLFQVSAPEEVYHALLSQGVLIRRQDHLVKGCLRVSIGTPEENDAFIAALTATLAS